MSQRQYQICNACAYDNDFENGPGALQIAAPYIQILAVQTSPYIRILASISGCCENVLNNVLHAR